MKLWKNHAYIIISSTYPSALFTSPTSAHKLHVNRTCSPWHNNNSFSNTTSSLSTITILLIYYAIHLIIRQFNDFWILILQVDWIIANEWTEESNKLFSSEHTQFSTCDIRRSQSCKVGSAFLIFLKILWKYVFLWSSPYCLNIWSKVTKIMNLSHNTFPLVLPIYKYLSLTRGNYPRSPTRIIDLPLKG